MAGGPSHVESLDPKPELDRIDGKPFPESFTTGQQLAQLQNTKLIARKSFAKFKKWGESGLEMSELFPHTGALADELCVIRSMTTEQINHDTAHAFMNTGSIIKGRPSMGSWMLYGLGAESQNLPGYVVMTSSGPGAQPVSDEHAVTVYELHVLESRRTLQQYLEPVVAAPGCREGTTRIELRHPDV